jgi:hypothetical protein
MAEKTLAPPAPDSQNHEQCDAEKEPGCGTDREEPLVDHGYRGSAGTNECVEDAVFDERLREHGGRTQKSVTSTTVPSATAPWSGGISMKPSAWDRLVMSPEPLNAG